METLRVTVDISIELYVYIAEDLILNIPYLSRFLLPTALDWCLMNRHTELIVALL